MSRMVTPLGLENSLKRFVEEFTDYEVFIRRDGLKVPLDTSYVIVTPLPITTVALSKGGEAMRSVHALQYDLFGISKRDISMMQHELRQAIFYNDFRYYTEDNEPTDLWLRFDDEIVESPEFSADLHQTSTHHSVHIGVYVHVVGHRNIKQ